MTLKINMDIITILRQDYAKFPLDQNYQIYAEDVYFQDPLTRFRGIDRYRQTIEFIRTWFKHPHLEVYEIVDLGDSLPSVSAAVQESRCARLITTRWLLSWNTPLPWYPRIEISGNSELLLNELDLIISHIDYWDRSPLNVLKQHFKLGNRG
jgi:Uncharacterized conserved protein (DUF2358)